MFAAPQLPPIKSRSNALEDATVREFSGGWNVVDNDLNLATRFATVLDNMSREEDGSMGVRWGTKWLSSIDDVNWLTAANYTLRTLSGFTQTAQADGASVTVNNPGNWHDANLSQNIANSTWATISSDRDLFSMTLSANIGSVTTDVLVVTKPTNGWVLGADAEQVFEIVVEAMELFSTEWRVIRQQQYTVGRQPATFMATGFKEGPGGVLSVRVTIRVPKVDVASSVTIAVAEVQVFGFTGTGAAINAKDVYIVNQTYFQGSVIVNLSNGVILRVLGDGTVTVIWSQAIAAGQTPAVAGWGATDFVSYAVFNGKLIVCNGTDKPLLIDFKNTTKPVQYLADEATGTNVNVPIARYVVAMNKYLVMAGDPLHPDRVHISNQNTSGTWYGDAAPNDATYVDLGKVGVQSDQTITGINRYRDQLVVAFQSASVLGKLGIYSTDTPPVHKPDFNDVIEGFGGHSHRCMVNLGNDLFMLDGQGVISIARSLYSGSTEPKRVSELIDPAVNQVVTRLREDDCRLGAHAVYNSIDKQYMCFVPNYSEVAKPLLRDPFEVQQDDPTELWVRIRNHTLEVGDIVRFAGVQAWNTVNPGFLNNVDIVVDAVINEDIISIRPSGINTDPNAQITGGGSSVSWTPQWTETLGFIYTFVNELKIRAWARYRGWRWRASCRTELSTIILSDDRRLFTLGNSNDPVYADFVNTPDEAPIAFAWELPWADFDQRVKEKHIRYVQLDTQGTAQFTMMMFVDMLYKLDGDMIPNNLMTFVGGDNGGYGNNGQPYGGGRRTADQRLYSWVARGKLFKLRFEGIVKEPLNVVAFSLLYQNGSVRR